MPLRWPRQMSGYPVYRPIESVRDVTHELPKNSVIPEGTVVTAYVEQDIELTVLATKAHDEQTGK